MAIQETWWSEEKLPNPNLRPFSTVHTNRPRRGGGTAILISQDLNYNTLPSLQISDPIQTTAIDIPESNTIFISYYNTQHHTCLASFISLAVETARKMHRQIIFLGDANAHHTEWSCKKSQLSGEIILQSINNNNLTIYNNSDPTRIDNNSNQTSVIDLCFGSVPSLRSSVINYGFSDHGLLFIPWKGLEHQHVNLKSSNNTSMFSNEDWIYFTNAITSLMQERRQQISDTKDIDHAAQQFQTTIQHALALTTSYIKQRQHKPRNHWFNKKIKRMITKRNTLMRELRKCSSMIAISGVKQRIRSLSNKIKMEIKSAKRDSWKKLLNQITSTSPATAWSLIKKAMGQSPPHSIPPLQSNDPTIRGKANTLNSFFSEMGRPALPISIIPEAYRLDQPEEQYPPITQTEVKNEIKRLNNNKSPGHDCISNPAIKHLPDVAIEMLTMIFNRSWNGNQIPEIWKRGIIHPIPKRKPALEAKDYRPITLHPPLEIFWSV